MSGQTKRTICVGEATVELSRGGDGRFALAISGDTFNTAIYLARAGVAVAFANALGCMRSTTSPGSTAAD